MTALAMPTWLVGCGNMTGALLDGWRAADIDVSGAVVIRPSGRLVEGIATVSSIAMAGSSPAAVILGFKPQQFDAVAAELAPHLGRQTVVISLLAGVEAASLRARLPKAGAIVRAMPNLPVAVRRGVVALYSEDGNETLRDQLSQLFGALGFALWVKSEAELAAIGSVAGAGPAYTARFIAALAKAGEARGLDPKLAATVALETVLGTGWMAAASGEAMADVARRVASPSGTTEVGLGVLDRALDELVDVSIEAAARRGRELAADARR